MRIGVPSWPARGRAFIGPRQRNTKEKATPRGAQSALHAEASGRERAITARASTSRLSCQSYGGRRLVANGSVALLARSRKNIQAASRRRHPRQAHHRKHIQAASRRRHPRQAYHRFRLKKGSQPWRRRWLSFDSELPSWRSTPRARPLVQDSRGLGPGARTGLGARSKLRLEVLTGSRQERYPAHGLCSGLARPGARTPTQPTGPEPPEPARLHDS